MKNTLTILSALAAMTMAANAATIVKLDSKLTDNTGTEASYSSAFDTFANQTKANALANAAISGADRWSQTGNITLTLNLANMFATDGTGEFTLSNISFLQRYDSESRIGAMTATLTVDGVAYTADSFTSGYVADTYGVSNFTFTNGPVLNGTETVTLVLGATTGEKSCGVLTAATNYAIEGSTSVSGNWMPVLSLSGSATTPEPATASLSLLGLAALMMRRRRA